MSGRPKGGLMSLAKSVCCCDARQKDMVIPMTTFNAILGAAQNLPASDRVRLIDALWETMAPNEWPAPSGQWIAEAQRRSAEYDARNMSASPWPEVRQRARREAGLDG